MKPLTAPRTHKQEILLHLITHGFVSIFNFPYMSGFRTRVSELTREDRLDIQVTQHSGKNKFGNTYNFHIHRLQDRNQAIELYKQLT